MFLQIGISYESDIELAKKMLADEIMHHPDFLDVRTPEQKSAGVPAVQVVVLELADSSVTLRASIWARDNGTAAALRFAVQERMVSVYAQNGIDIAYPHLVVVQK